MRIEAEELVTKERDSVSDASAASKTFGTNLASETNPSDRLGHAGLVISGSKQTREGQA